jgi:hypothetical protein|tara:strand:- start:92 stop:346 length:255 start_codon:yes stop_codon:yes gene_type:complete
MELTKIEFFSAIGVLVSIISCFWIIIRTHSKKDSEKLTKFEMLNEVNQKQIIELTGDYRELKGRISSVETLSHSVLEEIRKLDK